MSERFLLSIGAWEKVRNFIDTLGLICNYFVLHNFDSKSEAKWEMEMVRFPRL